MKKSIYAVLCLILCVFSFGFYGKINSNANCLLEANFDIQAKSALLVDKNTGTIIYEKNSNERLPIASMTKMFTLAVVYDAINKNIVKVNDDVVVSKNASKIGGSSAFLDAGSLYKLGDLIETIIIASANDSSVAIAEHLCGSEEMFVAKMNKFAKDLNLEDSHFENCTGLPCKNHYSTARDLVKIYKILSNNNHYLKSAKIWMKDFFHPSGRRTELVNTNRLIKTYDGIEGGKTGFTNDAKYCLTASAKRGEMSFVGVIIGAENSKTRFADMSKLFNFGFSNFKIEKVVDKTIPIANIKLKNAQNEMVLYPKEDKYLFLEKSNNMKFSKEVVIRDNLVAPVKIGDEVGVIYIFDENQVAIDKIEIVTKNDIEPINFEYVVNKIKSVW